MRSTWMFLVLLILTPAAHAQKVPMYRNAVGGRAEFGFGSWVGASWKHLYTRHHASEVNVLFGNLTTVLDLEYHFNGDYKRKPNFQWVLGFGGGVAFYKYYNDRPNDYFIRPIVGIDARLKGTPINIGVDWRPLIIVKGESNSTATRFGVPIRIAF